MASTVILTGSVRSTRKSVGTRSDSMIGLGRMRSTTDVATRFTPVHSSARTSIPTRDTFGWKTSIQTSFTVAGKCVTVWINKTKNLVVIGCDILHFVCIILSFKYCSSNLRRDCSSNFRWSFNCVFGWLLFFERQFDNTLWKCYIDRRLLLHMLCK